VCGQRLLVPRKTPQGLTPRSGGSRGRVNGGPTGEGQVFGGTCWGHASLSILLPPHYLQIYIWNYRCRFRGTDGRYSPGARPPPVIGSWETAWPAYLRSRSTAVRKQGADAVEQALGDGVTQTVARGWDRRPGAILAERSMYDRSDEVRRTARRLPSPDPESIMRRGHCAVSYDEKRTIPGPNTYIPTRTAAQRLL
jgi:hypothetical protein